MSMEDNVKLVKQCLRSIKEAFDEVERLTRKQEEREQYIEALESEVQRLKYEYPDSLLKRDKPLSPKWMKSGKHLDLFCPKCGFLISNWQGYCHACGQRIAKRYKLLPENEVKTDDV